MAPRGQRALAAPGCETLLLAVVLLDSAIITTFPDRSAAPQRWKYNSHSDRLCPPGYHASGHGECQPCTPGVDYTNHSNYLPECIHCTICNKDEKEIQSCIPTRDTECQCKPGTFRKEDSPEFCHKCRTRCPEGMVVESPCTHQNDLKCVPERSGIKANGEAPGPGEAMTTSPGILVSLSPVPDNTQLLVGIGIGVLIVLLLVLPLLLGTWTCRRSGGRWNPKHWHTVFLWRSCPPVGPGAQDNAQNEILGSGDSQSTIPGEVEEPENPTTVAVQSPEEGAHLLGSAEAEEPLIKRRWLIPVNDTDFIEVLRGFFYKFSDIVPFNSWKPLARMLGLTDNEIEIIEAGTNKSDLLYELLMKWTKKMGQGVSINTLLNALEELGERSAKDRIEELLVRSGHFIYQDDGAELS
ncbi:tumor necrosis factor receptor superfamily member 10A isoform X2 [Tupaia chinensis]|uniref:tumor necrosis factor receptor superfamily member 10A isoform X2 n=1 Tax=Tupaia chinensis TaxID=246437 RepID=UPI0003C8FB66|nr:tumor necrosis factor receptor superfamily member 10A isoform X2 [Tupaia chinensis]